jgi:hypothetical protein
MIAAWTALFHTTIDASNAHSLATVIESREGLPSMDLLLLDITLCARWILILPPSVAKRALGDENCGDEVEHRLHKAEGASEAGAKRRNRTPSGDRLVRGAQDRSGPKNQQHGRDLLHGICRADQRCATHAVSLTGVRPMLRADTGSSDNRDRETYEAPLAAPAESPVLLFSHHLVRLPEQNFHDLRQSPRGAVQDLLPKLRRGR